MPEQDNNEAAAEERMRQEQDAATRAGERANGERRSRVERGPNTVRVRIVHGKHHSGDGVMHDTGHVIDVPHAQFVAFRDQFDPVDADTLTHYEQEALDAEEQSRNLMEHPASQLAVRRVRAAAGPGGTEIPNRALARDGVTSSSTLKDSVDRHALGHVTEEEDQAAERHLADEQRVAEANATVATAAKPAQTPEKIEAAEGTEGAEGEE